MSNSTGNAIKALIESFGLGVSVYRDRAPSEVQPPYVTVVEAISVVSDPRFNSFDDSDHHVTELAQVDVWQPWKTADRDGIAETYTLADAIAAGLDGVRLADSPNHVAGMRLTGMVRLLEPDDNVVHHSITVELRRTMTRL